MPLLIHDEPTAGGFVAGGFEPEDAWDYCVIGCNELGVPGRSMETATATSGTILYINILTEMLLAQPEPDAISGMDDLMGRYREAMRKRLRKSRRGWLERRPQMAARVPTPFTSALMRGCACRGEDLLTGMVYQVPSYYERGLTNAVNALSAIERCVYLDHAFKLGELVDALRDNFAGERGASIRAQLRAGAKWGNDDDRADRWALAVIGMRETVLAEVDREFGDRTHSVCHVVRSLHHVDGRRLGATPDGRPGFTPVADSIGAETGTLSGGPTAVLNSVRKIDAARYYRGGYNLNITLPVTGTTPEIVRALTDGFFEKGGQELQVNCLDATALREARAHPERYPDLVVRVAGFSARFVDLSEVEQKELIERAEHCA
jgi:formate C-acetyltransferase